MELKAHIRAIRRAFLMYCRRLRFGFRHVDKTAYFAGGSWIVNDIEAGPHSFINKGCIITGKVILGRYVLLGPRVCIAGDDHRFDVPGTPMIFSGSPPKKTTRLEDDVWVGIGSILMSGVTIGKGSIVAAGSVVTRDVPPFEIHGGIPARKIRDRFADSEAMEKHLEMLNGPTVTGQRTAPRPRIKPQPNGPPR